MFLIYLIHYSSIVRVCALLAGDLCDEEPFYNQTMLKYCILEKFYK